MEQKEPPSRAAFFLRRIVFVLGISCDGGSTAKQSEYNHASYTLLRAYRRHKKFYPSAPSEPAAANILHRLLGTWGLVPETLLHDLKRIKRGVTVLALSSLVEQYVREQRENAARIAIQSTLNTNAKLLTPTTADVWEILEGIMDHL